MTATLPSTAEAAPTTPAGGTVLDLIESHVHRHPDKTAVLCGRDQVSYRLLWDTAHEVAERLLAHGCSRGDAVALVGPGNPAFMAAALGAWLVGAAWVPIDPRLPEERLRYVLDDTGARVVLATVDGTTATGLPTEPVMVPAAPDKDSGRVERIRPHRATSDDRAYLIYTSGSTGRPKGVAVGHHGLAVHLLGALEGYGMTAEDILLSFASPSFDAAVEEMWAPLANGSTVLLRGAALWTGRQLFERVRAHGVTYISCTTAYFEAFFGEDLSQDDIDCLGSLRGIIFGGEAVNPAVVRRWANGPLGSIPVCNTYGPTETVVTATLYWIGQGWQGDRVPIGHCLPGHVSVVLDAAGREVGDGGTGELYLGGPCVAEGYLGRSDLTAERFVSLPGREGTYYRTGDLVAVQGPELLFLGRADRQVKIRGFRIELEEVEAALQAVEGVRNAIVAVEQRADGGDRLVADVVPLKPADRDDPVIFRSALRGALLRTLPDYMIPSEIRLHTDLPLGVTGKVDRARVLAETGTTR
ncbi:amino acid adenylation domain-containing protein [Streptomyces sp. BR123]|uniref:amino acid adenylation domain-containing protein n=1 Tax=Streptomyces sp. BR123 TaxID=2749828 RepID=UPI0015C48201|nr:amino acid adenylation domain-containing protein [Streptomyces sp. BR123]NXY94234.1 amino acid adenylation domain-containing protein [Streptomyces sp. BR123]